MAGFSLLPCAVPCFSRSGNIRSSRYLSGSYPTPEFGIPTSPHDGYERVQTLVAMADVYTLFTTELANITVQHRELKMRNVSTFSCT